MSKKNSIKKYVVGFGSITTICISFALMASAQGLGVNSSLGLGQTKGDAAINARLNALNNLALRIGVMKNVPASEKSAIAAEIQTETSNLTNLKSKIDADTDLDVLLGDTKTITANYRIYALVLPQGYIIASADRVSVIAGLMTTLQSKLQVRITEAQAKGEDVTTMQAQFTDITAKVADAIAQAEIARNRVTSLVPDQGDITVAISNTNALLAARANIQVASSDLKAAREDIRGIMQELNINSSTNLNAQ